MLELLAELQLLCQDTHQAKTDLQELLAVLSI
jgi:hypothetical protein